jgi:type III pantothenate kinase
MNLTIDIGNSTTKIALFRNNEIILSDNYDKLTEKHIMELYNSYKFNNVILSSVVQNKLQIYKLNLPLDNVIELSHKTPLPIINLYKSPETLGNDRLAAVVGANNIFPENTVLVIDVGTAITYDIITDNAEYLGGNISPGQDMRFRALNKYTYNLPLLEGYDEFPEFGDTTESAIISGVQKGIIYEIKSYINETAGLYKNLKVLVTGGNINFFDKMSKKTIFVEPNLVLIGLNNILEYNVKKT